MSQENRESRSLTYALPSLAAIGSLGLLGYLRHRLQNRNLFVPAKYPDGIWEPKSFRLPAEDRWFHTPDGEELHGWWIPHPKPKATLLFFHGNTGSIGHQISFLRHLRHLKVNIFAFDYRGYGRSSGKPTEQGLYKDARAAHDHLIESLEQDAAQVVLFGHSLGGAIAVDCALDKPAAGLVVESSFTHLRDAARAVFPTLPLHLATRKLFHSEAKVPRIELPKLFIHGTADETVPFHLGESLFEVAAEPKEFYAVSRGGHNDVHRHGGAAYMRRISRFIRRCVA